MKQGRRWRLVKASKSIYTQDVLPPGERSPFLVAFSQRPPDWKTERLQVQAEAFSPQSFMGRLHAEGLTVDGVTLNPPANQFAGYTITGQVKNGGQQTAQFVAVIGILYDAEGKPLDVNQTFAELQQVDPGQTAPFSLNFPFTKAGVAVARHEVYVQGQVKS